MPSLPQLKDDVAGDCCEAGMARTRQQGAVVLATGRTARSTSETEYTASAAEVEFPSGGIDASEDQFFGSLADFGGGPDLLNDLFRCAHGPANLGFYFAVYFMVLH